MTIQEALAQSAEVLQRLLSEHQHILSLVLKEGDGKEIELPSYVSNSESGKFRQTLLEAIEVLEDTRKSFKSKRLEQLRRKLVRVLAELS